ncbi:TetR family transcriptional regulator [Rhodococcus kronopolitis]|uniref:TetR family transcriptional regulator n=1 Tax=Rhodococcus kronopolitis TaxID=1460226 RepID=A0ABV9FSY6_9NOCA
MSTARLTLVRAAERLVAERGLHGVRASEVVKAAGHRNNSAVTYHFGSWNGLLDAVWQLHAQPVNEARAVLIDDARTRGDYGLRTMVEAYLRPLTADLRRYHPSYWARFNEQWLAGVALNFFTLQADAPEIRPGVDSVLVVNDLFRDMAAELTHLPDAARSRRVALTARFVIGALAAWEREPDADGSPSLDALEEELIGMAVALLEAP